MIALSPRDLSSRNDSLRSLKTAIVSDVSGIRRTIDGFEMAKAGEGLRRIAGILEMAMLPMAQRFCDEIAELTLAAAHAPAGDQKAMRELAQRALQTLVDYLDDVSCGARTHPRQFVPLIGAMARARGVSPAFLHELCASEPPPHPGDSTGPETSVQEDTATRLERQHASYQRGLLRWFQGGIEGLTAMRRALDGVLRSQPSSQRALWWVAGALLEGLETVDCSPAIKKLCARVEQELRRLRTGIPSSGAPLLSDLLHAIATVCPGAPRAREVSAWYGLDKVFPEAYGPGAYRNEADGRAVAPSPVHETILGSLHAARGALERYYEGREGGLDEIIIHVTEACRRLTGFSPHPLADLLKAIAHRAGARTSDPPEHLSLDLAQALIIAEYACQRPAPYEAVAQTIANNAMANDMDAWRSSDRASSGNAIGSAVALRMTDAVAPMATEILKRLRQAQHLLGDFAWAAQKPNEIEGIATSMSQCAAVLEVLGAARAQTLCSLCAARIAEMAAAEPHWSHRSMAEIAEVISGLDLYCTALEQGLTDPERPLRVVFDNLGVSDPGISRESSHAAPHETAAMHSEDPGPSGCSSEADAELVSVFLEEAQEVLCTIESRLGTLRDDLSDPEALAELRRAFHTLKGSSRMVHLHDLGRVAHAMEDTLNVAIDKGHPATSDLVTLIDLAYRQLGEWIDALAQNRHSTIGQDELLALANRVKSGEPIVAARIDAADETAAPPISPIPETTALEATGEVVIGDVVMSATLFQTFATEAVVHYETLKRESERLDTQNPVEIRAEFLRASHTLAGISRTTGLSYTGDLAGALERWLQALAQAPCPLTPSGREVMGEAIAALGRTIDAIRNRRCPEPGTLSENAALIRRIDSQYIDLEYAVVPTALEPAGVERAPDPEPLTEPDMPADCAGHDTPSAPASAADLTPERHSRLRSLMDSAQQLLSDWSGRRKAMVEDETLPESIDEEPAAPDPAVPVPGDGVVVLETNGLDPHDPLPEPGGTEDLDSEILAFFIEESSELLSAIGSGLRAWRTDPGDGAAPQQLLRVLHNFKGSAHTVGAVHLSRLAHEMEDQVESSVAGGNISTAIFDALDERFDRLALATEALQNGSFVLPQASLDTAHQAVGDRLPDNSSADSLVQTVEIMPLPGRSIPRPDTTPPVNAIHANERQTLLRIHAEVADRLVSQAGEIGIARSRIETEMKTFKRGLSDLAVTSARVREQLHEIAIQAESQLQSRLSQVQSEDAEFDPLEFDRYTRLQELTRMISEGVSDVATVQQGLVRTLEHTAASLAEQKRIDREHHRDLMRLRSAPFNTIAERLYRAVRQAARETEKKVELTIRGGHLELNRTVLERMMAPLEHVLRNAVVHGIEPPEERRRAGKPEIGVVTVALRPEATEIRLTVSDDGAGLDIARIRDKALALGLITSGEPLLDEDLMQLIFSHGFSTAEQVTGLSGRGVGMDIVMSELGAIGGRVKVTSKRARGAYFSFFLPVTLGITQALLVRAGADVFPVPTVLVAQVLSGHAAYDQAGHLNESIEHLGRRYRIHYLPVLLGQGDASSEGVRGSRLLLLRAGDERVAVLVDEVIGNKEIMVKDVGSQIGSVQGILGATVLGDGRGALVINPIEFARRGDLRALTGGDNEATRSETRAVMPLVLVVDDSLTVRKFTSRLLAREGFRVATARDGIDALEQVRGALPDAILLDIEMPRMDGFELTRVLHSDPRTRGIPIVMVTSRTAEKHRQYALDLGVRVYLGKPYSERDLLAHIAQCTVRRAA